MKYLNTYKKLNESTSDNVIEEIYDNVHDICAELSDEDYNVNVLTTGSIKKVTTRIAKNSELSFKAKEIIETIIRIQDYLKTVGFHISSIDYFAPNSVNNNRNDRVSFQSELLDFINNIEYNRIVNLLEVWINIKEIN